MPTTHVRVGIAYSCLCGRKAIGRDGAGWYCAVCKGIEKSLALDHHENNRVRPDGSGTVYKEPYTQLGGRKH